jgi:hypothetical protein
MDFARRWNEHGAPETGARVQHGLGPREIREQARGQRRPIAGARKVKDPLGPGDVPVDRGAIVNARFDEARAAWNDIAGAAREIVEHDDVIPSRAGDPRDRGADEARASRDQDAHRSASSRIDGRARQSDHRFM